MKIQRSGNSCAFTRRELCGEGRADLFVGFWGWISAPSQTLEATTIVQSIDINRPLKSSFDFELITNSKQSEEYEYRAYQIVNN